jgi:hypothetical protein
MSRKNPTTYARKLPSPFDRFTARDWAHVRETAETLARNWSAEGYEGEHPQEFVATSQGYVEVSVSHDGAYARSGGVFAWEAEWPSAPLRRASTKRSKRAVGSKRTAGSTRAKRTRKVNQRSNPRRKKAAGARKARPASRSNPRGDDREVTIYEVIYDGHGAGAAGDGTHIARFKSASDAARFAANHTAWGRPTKADAAKVPVRLARRWGVM